MYESTALASNRHNLAYKHRSAFPCCSHADVYLLQFALGRCLIVVVWSLLPHSTLTLPVFNAFKRLSDAPSELYSVSTIFGPLHCLKDLHNRSSSCLCDLICDNVGVIRLHLDCSPFCSFAPQPSYLDKPADIPGCPLTSRLAPAAGTLLVVLLAPCSSFTPFLLLSSSRSSSSPAGASSTHSATSASPSSLPGGSMPFPSVIPTVCAVPGPPLTSLAFHAGSMAGSTTPTFSVIAPVVSSAVPLSVPASHITPSPLFMHLHA